MVGFLNWNFFLLAPFSSSSLSSLLASNKGGISVSVVSISDVSDAASSVFLSEVCCFPSGLLSFLGLCFTVSASFCVLSTFVGLQPGSYFHPVMAS